MTVPSLLTDMAGILHFSGYPLQYSWASLVAQLVKNLLAMWRPGFDPWVGKIPWRRERLPTPVFLGFPCGSAGKESACIAKTWVWSLGWEDPLEKGKATHSSILPWRIPWTVQSVHGVTESRTQLRDFHFHCISHLGSQVPSSWKLSFSWALEKVFGFFSAPTVLCTGLHDSLISTSQAVTLIICLSLSQ